MLIRGPVQGQRTLRETKLVMQSNKSHMHKTHDCFRVNVDDVKPQTSSSDSNDGSDSDLGAVYSPRFV